MKQQIIIEEQFCGPPDSGNGGYTCGMLASHIEGPAEVTLRLPPPLNKAMDVVPDPEGGVILVDDERVIARAVPASVVIDVPAPPSYDTAMRSAGNHALMDSHIFPTCFVCGPEREPADGLRIFAGKVDGRNYVASTWIPEKCFTGKNGKIKNEIVWAALDCPGAWSAMAQHVRPIVLGRMAVELIRPVSAGQRLIVIGWQIAEEGRKVVVGTALFDEYDELCAKARAIWIELK